MNGFDTFREMLYAGARACWPSLTPAEFGDAARTAVASLSGTANAAQVEHAIRQELIVRYGEPKSTEGAT